MRTLVIWVSGLIVSAAVGDTVGKLVDQPYAVNRSILGLLAGISVFACARLWIVQSNEDCNRD